MTDKQLPKIETAQNWAKAVNFTPKKNQIIIYDGIKEGDEYTVLPRLKIGDGIHKVSDLPFEDGISKAFVSEDGLLVLDYQ